MLIDQIKNTSEVIGKNLIDTIDWCLLSNENLVERYNEQTADAVKSIMNYDRRKIEVQDEIEELNKLRKQLTGDTNDF